MDSTLLRTHNTYISKLAEDWQKKRRLTRERWRDWYAWRQNKTENGIYPVTAGAVVDVSGVDDDNDHKV